MTCCSMPGPIKNIKLCDQDSSTVASRRSSDSEMDEVGDLVETVEKSYQMNHGTMADGRLGLLFFVDADALLDI